MTPNSCFLACTYYDLEHYDLLHPNHLNLNIPQAIWGNFSKLEDVIDYIKKIRKRKTDTLWGAWDIYYEEYENGKSGWSLNKIVKHFPPRKDHDFFGHKIENLKIAEVVAA